VYASKSDATDYQADIAIYSYVTDTDTGFVNMTSDVYETSSAEQVLAGDPDAVDSSVVSDNKTVFIVADYSSKGAITGYTVSKGIKNIKDLKNAEMVYGERGVIYDTAIDWDVQYVYGSTVTLVLVLGAKQSADVQYTAKDAQIADIIYVLSDVPEKQFSEYNLYKAVVNGKLADIKVDVDAENGAAGDFESIFTEGAGFYEITAWTNNSEYVYGVNPIDASEMTYEGVDVLGFDGSNDSVWAYASCHDGLGEGDYVVLDDNCKIYDVTDGNVEEIEAIDLVINSRTELNALGYESVNAVVADWNNYGFATVIYVVDGAAE
jgi:hypothetical protein